MLPNPTASRDASQVLRNLDLTLSSAHPTRKAATTIHSPTSGNQIQSLLKRSPSKSADAAAKRPKSTQSPDTRTN